MESCHSVLRSDLGGCGKLVVTINQSDIVITPIIRLIYFLFLR